MAVLIEIHDCPPEDLKHFKKTILEPVNLNLSIELNTLYHKMQFCILAERAQPGYDAKSGEVKHRFRKEWTTLSDLFKKLSEKFDAKYQVVLSLLKNSTGQQFNNYLYLCGALADPFGLASHLPINPIFEKDALADMLGSFHQPKTAALAELTSLSKERI